VKVNRDTFKQVLTRIYRAALEAVDPEKAVSRALLGSDLEKIRGRVYLAGIGKAGLPMAKAVEDFLDDRLEAGLIVVKDGYGGELRKTRVLESSHPQPDRRGVEAARQLTTLLRNRLAPDDLLIFVVSGGGSALLPYPVEPLTLEDKQAATAVLLRCGAEIQEINAIRKHLSQVKGGRLLDFTNGASVLSLLLSDVVGDDIPSIASGPTAADPTTFSECLEILEKYRVTSEMPKVVVEVLETGASGGNGAPQETPKAGDPRFERVENRIVGSNLSALRAAAVASAEEGFPPLILSSSITGLNSEAARFHVALVDEILKSGNPIAPPCCLISGGETTVLVQGNGKGGRNQEFALECALRLSRNPDAAVLVAGIGTDGTDGPTDAAGAVAFPDTVARARAVGMEAGDYLKRNDSYPFFQRLGDLVVTGPTRTNVMDLRIILVGS